MSILLPPFCFCGGGAKFDLKNAFFFYQIDHFVSFAIRFNVCKANRIFKTTFLKFLRFSQKGPCFGHL